MAKPFDYSKWDNIELSDDESDLHPNIDKESWFRLKHRTRVEREEREETTKANLIEANRLADIRIAEIDVNLKLIEEGKEEEVDEDPDAMRAEKQQLLDLNVVRNGQLEHLEKNKKWNWENMCTTVEETTVISSSAVVGEAGTGEAKRILKQTRDANAPAAAASSASSSSSTATKTSSTSTSSTSTSSTSTSSTSTSSKPAAPATAAAPPAAASSGGSKRAAAGPKPEAAEVENYATFVEAHEQLMDQFIDTESMDDSRELLRAHPRILMNEHCASFLLLSCLEDEMNGNHTRMRLCARQSQLLSHIAELGRSMNRHPRDLLDAFFMRMREGPHFMEFMSQVQNFIEKIQKRAVEKRKEMEAAGETEQVPLEQLSKEERLGPGGLDPVEVFDSLSPELQEAFETRDTEKLKEAFGAMPPEEAQDTLQRCIDSGLWVV